MVDKERATDAFCAENICVLLAAGVSVNANIADRSTPLHTAILYDPSKRLLQVPLDRGAEVEAKDPSMQTVGNIGHTPLPHHDEEFWTSLYDAQSKSKSTALHAAVRNGSVEDVLQMLHYGADVRAQNRYGWTALHSAARHDHPQIAAMLIGRGAEVNAQGPHGWTPLHFAAWNGCDQAVALLLEAGADTGAQCGDRWRALDIAAKKNYKSIVYSFLKKDESVYQIISLGSIVNFDAVDTDKIQRQLKNNWNSLRWPLKPQGKNISMGFQSTEERYEQRYLHTSKLLDAKETRETPLALIQNKANHNILQTSPIAATEKVIHVKAAELQTTTCSFVITSKIQQSFNASQCLRFDTTGDHVGHPISNPLTQKQSTSTSFMHVDIIKEFAGIWKTIASECLAGYVTSTEDLKTLLHHFMQLTSNRYFILYETKGFGQNEVNPDDQYTVWYEDRQSPKVTPVLKFDNTPYINLGTKVMCCQYGPDKHKKDVTKKKKGGAKPNNKNGCTARIIIKAVAKFPQCKISSNSKTDRVMGSNLVKETIKKGGLGVKRFYVLLPPNSAHTYHGQQQNVEIVGRSAMGNEYKLQLKEEKENINQKLQKIYERGDLALLKEINAFISVKMVGHTKNPTTEQNEIFVNRMQHPRYGQVVDVPRKSSILKPRDFFGKRRSPSAYQSMEDTHTQIKKTKNSHTGSDGQNHEARCNSDKWQLAFKGQASTYPSLGTRSHQLIFPKKKQNPRKTSEKN